MSEVKKRAYSSAVRQEQAAQTRARIVEAAAALFAEEGYGRTSIKAIAERAGVAVDTVYAVFGTKARVLTAIIDARLAPAGDASVLDRPEARAVRDEPDQRRQIKLFARDMAALSTRVRPVFEILRTAPAVEPELAALLEEMEGYRLRNMRAFVGWVAAHGPLRTSVDRAAESVWVVASPEVGRMLCDSRGWTERQHAAWLEDALVRLLLPDPDSHD